MNRRAPSSQLERLVDRLREELWSMQEVTDAAHRKYAENAPAALQECQWAFAAGQCRAIAERMLNVLREELARARKGRRH